MKFSRGLQGAIDLAAFLTMVASVPTQAQTLTALSLERSIAPTNILTTVSPAISPALIASLASGAVELREQSSFNSQQNTLLQTLFLVPAGAPNPTSLSFLPSGAFIAQTTVGVDKIYYSSKPGLAVQLVGIFSQSSATPYGNYQGAAGTFSFGYTADIPPKVQNIVETVAGTIVLYSASAVGTFSIVQPATSGGGGSGGGSAVTLTVNGQTGATLNFISAQSTVVLNASAASSSPGALTYSWAPAPGSPSFSLTGANTSTAILTLGNGLGRTYTINLTVTDAAGATATSTVNILFI